MIDDDLDQLAASARSELRDRLDVRPPGAGRLAQRRTARRRIVIGAVAAVVLLAVAVPVALRRGGDGTQVTAGPSRSAPAGTTVVDFVDLRGRVVPAALPESLADGFEIVEQSAALEIDGSSWRVDVTRTGEPPAVVTETCTPAPSAVVGRVGPWTINLSGDEMRPATCELLRSQVAGFEVQPNGFLGYRGRGTIGPIDGPDARADTATGRLALFHRSCSEPSETRTPSGLTVASVDDPARDATRTVLCSTGDDLELWIETARRPSREQLDAVDLPYRNPRLDLPLGHDRLGPVEVGMTVDEAEEALGEDVVEKQTGSGCAVYRPISTPDAIEFAVDDGRIVLIQAMGVASAAGVEVGDAEDAIREAYAQETVVDVTLPAVRRLLVRPVPDRGHATVFVLTWAGTVHYMRAGIHPFVEDYEKGCP